MPFARIYTNGNSNSNFSDIRFVNVSGVEYPFWRETFDDGVMARYWVNVTDDLSQSFDTTFYCYYGNSSATYPDVDTYAELDKMNDTFLFADNFCQDTLDTTKWNAGGDSITVTNGYASVEENEEIDSQIGFGVNVSGHSRAYGQDSTNTINAYFLSMCGARLMGDDSDDPNDLKIYVGSYYDNLGLDSRLNDHYWLFDTYTSNANDKDWHYAHFDKYDDGGERLSKGRVGSPSSFDWTTLVDLRLDGGDPTDGNDGIYVDYAYVCTFYLTSSAHSVSGPAFRTPGAEEYYSIIGEDVTASSVEETTATISSALWNDGVTEVGFWLGNESVNATDFDWNYSVTTTSGSNVSFSKDLTGLHSSQYYYFRAWAYEAGDFMVNSTFDGTFLTKPDAPSNFTQNSSGSDFVHLNWTKATGNVTNLTTMIRYGTLNYPATPTSGTLAYNGTASWANITGLDSDTNYYFSAWTYINASGSPFYWWYSDLYDMVGGNTTGGAFNVSIRWECNNTLVNLSGLTNVFKAYLVSGTVLNESNPTPADGTFSFDAPVMPDLVSFTYDEGPTRTIVVDPTSQNITIYIPCGIQGTDIGHWADITVHIVDYSGFLTQENNAIAYLYKYNGSTRQYIHMDYLQADMALRPYLTLGDTYYVGVGCDVFSDDNVGPITITESEYFIPVYYVRNQTTTWGEAFEIDYGWDGNTLFFDFEDTTHTGVGGVDNVTIQLYYIGNYTLVETWYPPIAPWDFNYTNAVVNNSFDYEICLTVRYNTSSENWQERQCFFIIGQKDTFIDDPSFVNRVVSQILGESPVSWEGQSVAWTSLVAAFLSIYVFFTLSERYAGFGVMLVGVVMGIMKFPLGLITNVVFNWIAVVLIVFIGVLMVLQMKKRS